MKNLTLSLFASAFFLFISGCTKEQNTLNILHGTWKVTSQLDSNGDPVPVNANCTTETLVTFFLCDDNHQGDCSATTKVTRTCTSSGQAPTVNITAAESSYSVYAKDILVLGATTYEIESISKKELKVHPTSSPKATTTYEKQ